MTDLTALIQGVRAVLAATWPEVVHADGQILEAEHADRIPWADLVMPYAVILIEAAPASELSPLDEVWVEPEVQCFYVTEVLGASSGIRGKLAALKAAFWTAGVPDPLAAVGVGQVLGQPSMSWSASLAPNAVLRARDSSARAGLLSLSVLVPEST